MHDTRGDRDEHDKEQRDKGVIRAVGLGLITGAADDDPSAIGTYAAAGATFGPRPSGPRP